MREPFPSKSLRSAEGGGRALRRFLDFVGEIAREDPDAGGDAIFTPPYRLKWPFLSTQPSYQWPKAGGSGRFILGL